MSMGKMIDIIIKRRKIIFLVFIICCLVSVVTKNGVLVNYDINSYLPDETESSVALEVMKEEFSGGIPNAKVMIKDVTITEALEYKEQLSAIDGVDSVMWLDDSIDVRQPLEMQDADTIADYYKDNNALYSLTIAEDKNLEAVQEVKDLIGEDNAMSGTAVSKAMATINTEKEVDKITLISIIFAIFILIITTTSWVEPLIVMLGLGVAILLNTGTHILLGEISFVTNAAGNILQLAVSLDYSVFLIHRFTECRKEQKNLELAMGQALRKTMSSILSSGMTTVIGFLALVLMRFEIGPDLGIALAKGVVISLLTVFFFMPGFVLMTYKLIDRTSHRPFVPELKGFGKAVSKVMIPLVIAFTIIIVPSYLASVNNSYHFGSSQIYGPGTEIGDEALEIKEVFGKGDTYVLLVEKGEKAVEKELSDRLASLEQVDSVLSFVDAAGAEVPYEYLDDKTLSLLESDTYSRMVISVNVDYEGDDTIQLISELREIAQEYYPGKYHLAGEGISTYDLRETVMADLVKVNVVAVVAVLIVLLISMRSVLMSLILVLTIETAIWINFAIPYFAGDKLFYIAYLLVTSIQLGATVDYAILMAQRYKENRECMDRKTSVIQTIAVVTPSILTSGIVMIVVGFLMGAIVTHGIIAQMGLLLGRGTVCSVLSVLFVLPGYLYLLDKRIIK